MSGCDLFFLFLKVDLVLTFDRIAGLVFVSFMKQYTLHSTLSRS